MAKPTGKQGPLRIGPDNKATLEKVEFSSRKSEVELQFFNLWVAGVKRDFGLDLSGTQNEENNFDFTVKYPDQTVYLDMAEVILPSPQEGSPYQQQNTWRRRGDVAATVASTINTKSQRYASKSSVPIHLLLYATHSEFRLTPEVIQILQYTLAASQLVFAEIWYVHLIGHDHPIVYKLYPADPKKFIPEAERSAFENGRYYKAQAGQREISLKPEQ